MDKKRPRAPPAARTGPKSALGRALVEARGPAWGMEFRWKNREKAMNAPVVPGARAALFGALPVEALDVMAGPAWERLVGRRGEEAVYQPY